MTSVVCFDLGGVFLDWDPRYLYREMFAGDDAAMEHFLAEVCPPQWHSEMDRGRSIAEACAERKALFPASARFIDAWRERAEDMVRGLVPGMVEIFAELRERGTQCFALSNMERENWDLRLSRYDFLGWFDGYFISGYEGVVKPEPEYFLRAVQKLGFDPAQALFVDDRPENVEAAAVVGMPAVVFTGAVSLRQELAARRLLPPAPH